MKVQHCFHLAVIRHVPEAAMTPNYPVQSKGTCNYTTIFNALAGKWFLEPNWSINKHPATGQVQFLDQCYYSVVWSECRCDLQFRVK